jgi:hypothetical protein
MAVSYFLRRNVHKDLEELRRSGMDEEEALPVALMGDSADPKRVKMRTTFEEAKHVLRSRLVNPKRSCETSQRVPFRENHWLHAGVE